MASDKIVRPRQPAPLFLKHTFFILAAINNHPSHSWYLCHPGTLSNVIATFPAAVTVAAQARSQLELALTVHSLDGGVVPGLS
ncbi:hypothetical protein ED733_007917 [Metarhizium rileyi]|nr:hypothetical protein ED733_007917 [Metarhizium rileyi]